MPYAPSAVDTPFERLGGEPAVRAIVERFYDAMTDLEPALAALHPRDPDGRVARDTRERFALFFVGWLGGPQDYTARHGHPRLRMRHARVPIDSAMAAAWMRCMTAALDASHIDGDVRVFIERRLEDLTLFLRNRPDGG
ncbi:MAG TPA: group II truncated hemoglobin [Polyangiaceae bacterium]|nr:group II truncated hemoglobin [Polyangiaceae bacterium]